MLKIMIIPSWYPTEKDPLWGNYFIQQATALSNYAEVSMLNIDRVGFKQALSLPRLRAKDGFDAKRHPFPFFGATMLDLRAINRAWGYRRYARAAHSAYKKFVRHVGTPDLILAESSLPAGLAARLISEREGVPNIIHEHSQNVLTDRRYCSFSGEAVRGASACLAVNDAIAKGLRKLGGRGVEILSNYIDAARFALPRKKGEFFTLLSVSNFYKVKAIDMLLDALCILTGEMGIRDIRLRIVGTGAYRDYYRNYASEHSLDDYVEFSGFVPQSDIPAVYAQSDVLCVSSEIETFCIPIAEAFAAGIPVVSTRCGGPDGIVPPQCGLLTPVGDARAFAEAILKLKENRADYNPDEIRLYAAENFDKAAVCAKLLAICETAIKG